MTMKTPANYAASVCKYSPKKQRVRYFVRMPKPGKINKMRLIEALPGGKNPSWMRHPVGVKYPGTPTPLTNVRCG